MHRLFDVNDDEIKEYTERMISENKHYMRGRTYYKPLSDTGSVVSEEIDITIQERIISDKRNYRDDRKLKTFAVGREVILFYDHVFMPEHKDLYNLTNLTWLSAWTALTGSEGEPEMYAVLRKKNKGKNIGNC